MNIKNILLDLLRGAAAALLMGLLVCIAHGGILWITILAAAVFLFLAVLLLQSASTGRRQLRSIAAILLFFPALMLYGKSGFADFCFDLMHPAGAEVAIGDAVQMVFIILPGVGILLLLAVLLARIVSNRQTPASPREATHADDSGFPAA
ncbi:MAG: hypothetical protein IKI45_02345 [Oscillospiraceae bacterium]|nr:hypothetical protein [Oscillospiraceae bacterium]